MNTMKTKHRSAYGIFGLWVISIIVNSCNQTKKEESTINNFEIEITHSGLLKLVDSLTQISEQYVHCSHSVGYIQVLENTDSTKKIWLSLFDKNNTSLQKAKFDFFFKYRKTYFFIDGNLSPLFKQSTHSSSQVNSVYDTINFQKKELDCQLYVNWLILIKDNQIIKQNLKSINLLGPKCENCEEWKENG